MFIILYGLPVCFSVFFIRAKQFARHATAKPQAETLLGADIFAPGRRKMLESYRFAIRQYPARKRLGMASPNCKRCKQLDLGEWKENLQIRRAAWKVAFRKMTNRTMAGQYSFL